MWARGRSSLFNQNRAILLAFRSDSSTTEIRLLATMLSVFLSQMQALSQRLWVLCDDDGMASMCGRGFRAVALCLAKIDPFYWPSDSYSTEIRLGLSCSLCFRDKCRLLAKGCGFLVQKWVWPGISEMRERFQNRSSLFSQNRAILFAFRLLQY